MSLGLVLKLLACERTDFMRIVKIYYFIIDCFKSKIHLYNLSVLDNVVLCIS